MLMMRPNLRCRMQDVGAHQLQSGNHVGAQCAEQRGLVAFVEVAKGQPRIVIDQNVDIGLQRENLRAAVGRTEIGRVMRRWSKT